MSLESQYTKSQIAVVIPVYKVDLNDNETVSLNRCLEILSDYRIIFIAPEGLDLTEYKKIIVDLDVYWFDPINFQGISSYSKLMMSASFYRRFIDLEYILIYQLDAYVFQDELLDWCNLNYDYVGAPWIESPRTTKHNVTFDFNKRMLNRVGNGGFSLRKIKTHIKVCSYFKPFLYFFSKNEDIWWGYLIDKMFPWFKKPSLNKALSFAFELAPEKAFKLNKNKLPFGCHAWEKYNPIFWKQHILQKEEANEN